MSWVLLALERGWGRGTAAARCAEVVRAAEDVGTAVLAETAGAAREDGVRDAEALVEALGVPEDWKRRMQAWLQNWPTRAGL